MVGRSRSLLLLVLLFLSPCSSHDRQNALEKISAAHKILRFIRMYCIIAPEYDHMVVCLHTASKSCDTSFEMCLRPLEIVTDRLVGYMFTYCTGIPPMAQIMELQRKNQTHPDGMKLPPENNFDCKCTMFWPINPSPKCDKQGSETTAEIDARTGTAMNWASNSRHHLPCPQPPPPPRGPFPMVPHSAEFGCPPAPRLNTSELNFRLRGRLVELSGRVTQKRASRFMTLRDQFGTIQLVAPMEELRMKTKKHFVELHMWFTVLKQTRFIQLHSQGLNVPWSEATLQLGDEEGVYPIEWVEDKATEIVTLTFQRKIRVGKFHSLVIRKISGDFGEGFHEVDLGRGRYLLTMGPHNTNLRSIFPCYDEPEFRATYQFDIFYPAEYTLVVNSHDEVPNRGALIKSDDNVRYSYKINKRMSTYSIALMMTDMESETSTNKRVKVYHPKTSVRGALTNIYTTTLLSIEKKLKIPLFPQLLVIYNPSLVNLTVVKWGVISVGPDMTPVENSVVHSVELKDLQKEICRSLFQLYFGHLISPQWWTDQWVLHGISRYFAAVMGILKFDADSEFQVDTVQMVIRDNSLWQHYLERPYHTVHEINNPSMFAVDHKAAALMRQLSNIMQENKFNIAARRFLANNRYQAVSSKDFCVYLEKFSNKSVLPKDTTITQLVEKYSNAPAKFELIRVALGKEYSGTSPFFIARLVTEETVIPVDYMTQTIQPNGAPRFYLEDPYYKGGINVEKGPWIAVNPEQYGLYCTYYSDEIWASLSEELKGPNYAKLNRKQLISDSISNVPTTHSHPRHFLELLRYLPKETDVYTWKTLRISYEIFCENLWGYPGDLKVLYQYFRDQTRTTYLGNRLRGHLTNFEKTMDVARIACNAGLPECLQDVEDYYMFAENSAVGLLGSQEFQRFIYCTMAQNYSDAKGLASAVMNLWTKDRSFNSLSRSAVRGMACSRDTEVIKTFLDASIANHLEGWVHMTSEERLFLLRTFLQGGEVACKTALSFAMDNFDAVEAVIKPVVEVFRGMRYYLRGEAIMEIYDKFNKKIMDKHSDVHNLFTQEHTVAMSMDRSQEIHAQLSKWIGESQVTTTEKDGSGSVEVFSWMVGVVTVALIKVF